MLHLGTMIPQLKSRQSGARAGSDIQPQQSTAGGGGGGGGSKKGKGAKRR